VASCQHCKKFLHQTWANLIKSTLVFGAKKKLTTGERIMIEFLQYLDESNLAYLIMLFCFLVMTRLHLNALTEITRLRKIMKQVMR
jgi:positive regulator of sigma E activity